MDGMTHVKVLSVSASPSYEPGASASMSSVFVVVLLAMLLGFQPLTTDLYLPALPLLSEQLQASVAQTQSTFSVMILAFGCSQLVWGPLSDRFGRRPILLLGIALYALASLGCAVAPDVQALIVCRALQGAALGALIMAARAIVRDLYGPAQGAHVMSQALTGLGALACTSPLIGSLLSQHWGWRSTMVVLAIFATGAWLLVWLRFQESLRQRSAHALQPQQLAHNYWAIVRNRTFLAYTATTACSYSALVVFLTGAPFTFTQVLGWSIHQVGWLLCSSGIVYMAGTVLCRRLLPRWGGRQTVAIAGGLALACAALLLTLALLEVTHGLAYASAFLLFPLAHGIQQSCGQSGAVSSFPQTAGMASALNGFITTVLAFATGLILGYSFNGTVYPLVFGVSLWCFAAALASWTLVRRYGVPSTTS